MDGASTQRGGRHSAARVRAAVVVRCVARCGSLLRSECGCRSPDPLFPQATGEYNEGMTALLLAAQAGSLELCQWLVRKNADVNAKA